MFCISVSFKKTPLEIRQQFAFSQEEQTAVLSYLKGKNHITGGVIVSTCNRSEIYFTKEANPSADVFARVETVLAEQKQIPGEWIKKYCLYYQGKKAVRHLYRVACGLDSMVLGEDEVLRQVKEAYVSANEQGFTDSELNILFQGAFHCAKLSKSETRLSNTPVSVGTLTANTAAEFLKERSGEKESLPSPEEKAVLVIGATGKIGSIVAKNLAAKGIAVTGTSRRTDHGRDSFCREDELIRWIDFDRRYEAAAACRVIISATSSPHYTLTKEEFLRHKAKGDYLLMDLAVPCDIDRELKKEEGITLLDIDHFKEVSRENTNLKLGERQKAEEILEKCVEEELKKLYLREFQEQEFYQKMENQGEENWFRKMTFYLRDVLDSEQLSAVLNRICQCETEGEKQAQICRR
jgi:glutamyl-tRNA reductase